jgi:hypothetical protein
MTDGICYSGPYLEGDPRFACALPMFTTWEDIYFLAPGFTALHPGEVVSFRVYVWDLLIGSQLVGSQPMSNTVTVNIGYVTPTIKEIKVTGIPDTANPTTNCPNTPIDYKVKLEAKIDCSEHFQIVKTSWSGDDVKAGEGNPYEYGAAPTTQGYKNVICRITYRSVEYGWTGTDTKSEDFKLFFSRDDSDDGKVPNWFRYWNQIAGVGSPIARYDPSIRDPKTGGLRYGEYTYGSPTILIGDLSRMSFINSETGHVGIDCFAETVIHELIHKSNYDKWWVKTKYSIGNGPNQDADGDLIPNSVETAMGLNPNNPDTDGNGVSDEEELASAAEHAWQAGSVRGLDWANPGEQTNAGAAALMLASSASTAHGGDVVVPAEYPTATLTGSMIDQIVDTNADGLCESLAVDVGVNVTVEGNYSLRGGLSLGGDWTLWGRNSCILNVGVQSLRLSFDGVSIRQSRVDGPYPLVLLELYNDSGSLMDGLVGSPYNTSAYAYSSFAKPTTGFVDSYSDFGRDTDGDGFYDYLVTMVGVNVASAGNYGLSGWLYDGSGVAVGGASNFTYLDAGSHSVALGFDGLSIRWNRVDGPYQLEYLSLRCENGTQVDLLCHAYNTSAVGFASFQCANAWFTGAYENRTEDVDADGLFDYLTIGANVTVTVSGNYSVAGCLGDCNGTEIADASCCCSFNSSGDQEVYLTFQGLPIYQHGADGPYTFSRLTLYDENGTIIDIVSDAYNTSAYEHTEFTNIPEFPVSLILPTFVITTLVAVAVCKRTRKRRC